MTTFRLFISATMVGVLALLIVYQPTAAGPAPLWVTGSTGEPNRFELQAQSPATTTLTGGEVQPQDEAPDPLVYLPIIFKNNDASLPWHSFSLTKTATPKVAQPDGLLVYAVQYYVNGSAPAPSLTLIDSLPPNTSYVSCEGGLNCWYSGSKVIWGLGSVNPNTSGRVTTTVRVDSAVVSGTVLYNSVALSNTFGMMVTDAISTPVQVPEPEPGLDLALVFDVSGSMQFGTICYGCYEPYRDGSIPWTNINTTTDPDYSPDYPNPAYLNPIPIDHLPNKNLDGTPGGIGLNTGQLCFGRDGNGTAYYTGSGGGSGTQRFVIIEAELYSMNNSVYDHDVWQPGRGFWAVQHTNWRTVARMLNNPSDPDSSYGTGARAILPSYARGSWVSQHPFVSWQIQELGLPLGYDYTLADAEADTSPSLEYDFIASSDWDNNDAGQTRIWARMQAGGTFADNSVEGWRSVYWTVYEDGVTTPLVNIRPASTIANGPAYGGADDGRWRWIEFTNGVTLNLENGKKYTLKIWAGGVGVGLDWIAIGNSSATAFQTDNNARATSGSAFRQACNRCNPIYGRTIAGTNDCLAPVDNGWNTVAADNTNLLEDDLFSGYWPMRGAKEAVKRFIRKLDPQRDQLGVVAYNSDTDPNNRTVKLQCLRRAETNPVSCFAGPDPISYTQLIDLIERVPAYNGTNIAQGMRDGLEVLGIETDAPGTFDNDCLDTSTSSHCGRGAEATQVMIVITDGVPNTPPVGACANDPNLYLPNTGNPDVDEGKDCVIYYANIAAANGVIIHTIGLGNGADADLLAATASVGSGQFFAAATPDDLDAIFDLLAP